MTLCPQLVMACEFSLGLLPYIKILLSSPTFRGCKNGLCAGLLAGGWVSVAAILVVAFELSSPRRLGGMKDTSIHT